MLKNIQKSLDTVHQVVTFDILDDNELKKYNALLSNREVKIIETKYEKIAGVAGETDVIPSKLQVILKIEVPREAAHIYTRSNYPKYEKGD